MMKTQISILRISLCAHSCTSGKRSQFRVKTGAEVTKMRIASTFDFMLFFNQLRGRASTSVPSLVP